MKDTTHKSPKDMDKISTIILEMQTRSVLTNEGYVPAIRFVRWTTGWYLSDSKEFVDGIKKEKR